MIVYKRVFIYKWHRWRYTKGRVHVEFMGWFLLGVIPLILWQASDEDRE